MISSALKLELQELIEKEKDLSILKAIKALLLKNSLNVDLKEKLSRRAVKSEEDIKAGRVFSREEIIKRTDKLFEK